MSDSDLFLRAARTKLRFPSSVGALTVEDLFDLPIRVNDPRKASLESVGNALLLAQRDVPEASILATETTNPTRAKLDLSVEIVKFIIQTRQSEIAAATARIARRQEADRLNEIIAGREASETPLEELKARLAALGQE